MAELSEVFWTFLISSVISLLLAMIRMCYKSKCKTVSCCGLKVERDIESEELTDVMELDKKNNGDESPRINKL